MPAELLTLTEVAREFLVKAGYLFTRLEKSHFDREKKQWTLVFDVGITVQKLKKIVVDDTSGKVVAFE